MNGSGEAVLEVVQSGVEFCAAIGWCGQITRLGIPRHVAFKKEHAVATRHQSLHQSTVGRGVTVPPGGSNGQPQNSNVKTWRTDSTWRTHSTWRTISTWRAHGYIS